MSRCIAQLTGLFTILQVIVLSLKTHNDQLRSAFVKQCSDVKCAGFGYNQVF